MEDNFLADLHRAITHGKVEVWVSVRDVEERYPTSYHIESYQDIFDVVREDLQTRYIDYDWVEKHFVLEEIIVDGEEIDLELVDAYEIFKEVYARKLKEYSGMAAHEEALKERNRIIQKNEEEIWQKMKNGKRVELKFGWFYS